LILYFANAASHFVVTVQCLMGIVTVAGLLILALYRWMDRNIPIMKTSEKLLTQRKRGTKTSLIAGLRYLLQSPSLGCIALMVIGYGLSVNMIEVAWKATLKMQYPNPQDYEAFMGRLTSAIGILSLILAVFVGGNVIRKFGWYMAAQSTPIVLGCVSALFFGIYFIADIHNSSNTFLGVSTLSLVVFCGAIHNVCCKSMKYCLFDPTKEMAYIPLDEESKVKGKAAVDVVASRFGKSGSSWIQAIFMEFAGVSSVLGILSYLTPCIMVAIVGWAFAVYYLHRRQIERTA